MAAEKGEVSHIGMGRDYSHITEMVKAYFKALIFLDPTAGILQKPGHAKP